MVTPIKKDDLARQVIEELNQELTVTQSVLVKVLTKTGDVTITGEELKDEIEDNTVVDMSHDEASDTWTFSLKVGVDD